jgi:hypothetical protein
VQVPGGYVRGADHNKLLKASSNQIDLSLTRTCRRIREEMYGLPLQRNGLKSWPSCTLNSSERAGALHATVRRVEWSNVENVAKYSGKFLIDAMAMELQPNYPQFQLLIVMLRSNSLSTILWEFGHCVQLWCKTPSIHQESIQDAFLLLRKTLNPPD